MKYTIKTPVEGYTGISASLHFLNGKAETDNDKLVEWFIKHGYQVYTDDNIRVLGGNYEIDEKIKKVMKEVDPPKPAKPKTTRKKGGNSND